MSKLIPTWQDRTGNHNIRPGSVKHMLAEIAELRAALQAQQGDALDAARWRFMMAVTDNEDGPEAKALDAERTGHEAMKDDRSQSAQLVALVDAAMLAARREG